MVKFRDLVTPKRSADLGNLVRLFQSFDREASHTELRPAQAEALEKLSARRSDHDVVLKISTGAGKTAVGLTYLQSHMDEQRRPVVYLCPTIQLVEQVCDEATHLGLAAVQYPANKPQPDSQALSAKAIIVCTYDKLFNARTTFDRSDVHLRPYAMVLDDAHAGVEEVRNAFTLRLREPGTYDVVRTFLSGPCSRYRPGVWGDIENGDPRALLEVPYWLWRPLVPEIRKTLAVHSAADEFKFVWGFLRDILERCRCVISGSVVEIVPDVLPVGVVKGYSEVSRRLFMSATLADDSVLVREMDCASAAASTPVVPTSDRGLGERMVIAPSLIDPSLGRDEMMKVCKKLSRQVRVVVLSPSEAAARQWEAAGATVFMRSSVADGVRALRDRRSGLRIAAFAQRYDGLDLPDDACRVLVLDGLPVGEGATDRYDGAITDVAGGARSRLVYRLEQGMGRAVRSHVDYAVVLLIGPELSTFIARRDVQDGMSPDTRVQLQLAQDLAQLARAEDATPMKALSDLIGQCLSRDEGWKQYYDEKVREPVAALRNEPDPNRIALAAAERAAAKAAFGGDAPTAVQLLREALNQSQYEGKLKGVYLQRIAGYMFEIDEGKALEIQQAAQQHNADMFRPPAVLRHPPALVDQAGMIAGRWLAQFENVNGAIAHIQVLRGRLNFAGASDTVEQALSDLAELVGASGSRPEKDVGDGPDDLWIWSGTSLVVEAKTGNQDSLHKKDAGQLLQSLEWFKSEFGDRRRPVPVVVAATARADKGAQFPDGTRVLRWNELEDLLAKLESFYLTTGSELPIFRQPEELTRRLRKASVIEDGFISKFTVALERARR
jgi:hypothetical protein